MSTTQKQRVILLLSLVLVLFERSLEKHACAQAPEDKAAASASLVRPCAARQESGKKTRKNKTKRKTDGNSDEFSLACLEAEDSALNIQEFFQSYIRAQGWRFSDEKIVADGWMFARHLDKDELLQFAKEGRFAGRVTWTEGKAMVLVTTLELDNGFTRTEVTAQLQGFGQRVDRFAPPKDTWDLDSSGALEKTLIEALEDHLKSLHERPSP